MAVFNEPTKWQTSLVNSGDANTIPQTTPAGTGEASFEDGFPPITQVPIGAGGQAPDRKDFNGLFKVLGDSIFYMQNGGLWSYNSAFDYAVGRVVLYTDGNLYKCIQANSSTSPKAPTNSAYWTKIPTLSDFDEIGFKTGDIKIQTTSTIPSGWLLCNGAVISRSTFSNLFTKIGTTYGLGDGSTTFNIPDLRDRYIIGADTNALGTKIAEQLPNIRGKLDFKPSAMSNKDSSGALSGTTFNSSNASLDVLTATGLKNYLNFNANTSSSIYTDSGKVHPLSLALNFIIKT